MTDDASPAKTFTPPVHFLVMLPTRVPDELAKLQKAVDPGVYKRAVELVTAMDASFVNFDAYTGDGNILFRARGIALECYVLKDAPSRRQADELFMVLVFSGPTILSSYHTNAADAAQAVISERELFTVD